MRTRHVSTTSNIPLGELYDTRHYLLPSGRRVSVKTLCEMGGKFVGRIRSTYCMGVDWGFQHTLAIPWVQDHWELRAVYPGRLPRMVVWCSHVKLFFMRLWYRPKL